MNLFVLLLAFTPTVIVVSFLLRVIFGTKQFDLISGQISDLNRYRKTRPYLFTSLTFWEICQTAYLLLMLYIFNLVNPVVLGLLILALLCGLIGLPLKSRTLGHDFFILSSIFLSYIIMVWMTSVLFTVHMLLAGGSSLVLFFMFFIGARLLLRAFHKDTTDYWKVEFIILALYAAWNIIVFFVNILNAHPAS